MLDKKINQLIKSGPKPTIGFGLLEPNKDILSSLRKSKKLANIILVGPKKIQSIKGFKKIISSKPEQKIIELLVNKEIDGMIRGTLDEHKAKDHYKKLTGETSTFTPMLMKDPAGRYFFISPVNNSSGWTKKERYDIAKQIADMLIDWGIKPKIAVFTGIREATYKTEKHQKKGLYPTLCQTWTDAEWIVKKLKKDKFNAKNYSIDFNPAVEDDCNLLVPVNGLVGNQLFRVMLVYGGILAASPNEEFTYCYEENSRTEKDFSAHVRWVVAWINKKKNESKNKSK